MTGVLMVAKVAQLVMLVALPPMLPGVIAKVKAFFAGRVGPPLLQPYHDTLKLLRKGCVTSRTTTWVFAAGPAVGLATALTAGLIVPTTADGAWLQFSGDMVLFAYLLALGRFFTIVAALDTGSSFEGMGAAREATFSCLAEPALFLGLLVLGRVSGSLSLSGMLSGSAAAWQTCAPSLILVASGVLLVLLAENSRVPVDDPNTHLELTMIHEVMVLDHSGPALGLIHYGAAVKLYVFAILLARVVFPVRTGVTVLDAVLVAGVVLVLAGAIGVLESVMARLRLGQVSNLLIAASLLCGFGFLLAQKGAP